jgi:carbon storage regulator
MKFSSHQRFLSNLITKNCPTKRVSFSKKLRFIRQHLWHAESVNSSKRAQVGFWQNVSWMKVFNGLRWNMLVLTRRVDESIRIGDDIRITVVKIKGTQQICVGVDAPRDVPVLREELLVERSDVSDEVESSNS